MKDGMRGDIIWFFLRVGYILNFALESYRSSTFCGKFRICEHNVKRSLECGGEKKKAATKM